MLKTISAALLAASVIAAPAFAAGTGKTAQTSAVKTEQATKNGVQAKSGKSDIKSGALNANAKMHRHHHKYQKMGALKSNKNPAKVGFNGAVKTKSSKAKLGASNAGISKVHANKPHSKVSLKHAAPVTKRG